jgi:hypothetical protein
MELRSLTPVLDGPNAEMSRVKNPQQKKRNELRSDHRTAMEAPHAFRKGWPKKKALANRRHRRRLQAQLHGIESGSDPDGFSAEPHLRSLVKSGTTSLSEAVRNGITARVTWTGAQYTLKPYSRAAAEKFRQCVASLVRGRRGRSRDYARWLLSLIDEQQVPTSTLWYQQRWVHRFLADYPEVGGSIREWARGLSPGGGRPTSA